MIGERRFDYHRAVAPMMWVMVGLCAIELLVVHSLIALWSLLAAGLLSAITLASIVWLVSLIRSMRRLPVLLDDERLLMRVGTLRAIAIPLSAIAGLRPSWSAEALKAKDVRNLALIAYPNVVVDLATPVAMGRRSIRAVAHRLDDPHAFVAALTAALATTADIRT